MKTLVSYVTNPSEGALILDFFAGSGTLGQAVAELNEADGGDRSFILVQLPELTGREDFPTICDLMNERLRRVVKQNATETFQIQLPKMEHKEQGFRVFQLATSNFTTWDAQMPHDAGALVEQLELHFDHVREGRSGEDIFYEILLKSGYPLTTPVESSQIEGKTIFSVAEGLLVVCLEQELTLELIRAVADTGPERVVCLDAGFAGNDQLKANAAQLFKNKDIVLRTV